MKRLLFLGVLAATVFACTPKAVPAGSQTGTSTNTSGSTGSTTNTGSTGSTASANTAAIEAGHTVYTSSCGRCHKLYDPGTYTAESWEPIVNRMAPKARLSEEQTTQVKAYVKANAKK